MFEWEDENDCFLVQEGLQAYSPFLYLHIPLEGPKFQIEYALSVGIANVWEHERFPELAAVRPVNVALCSFNETTI